MRFSIVTISYNQAQFVRSAIESVLAQDYPELEYVVVDPGSTDGARDVIEAYRGRITQIVYRPDRGAAEGLNNGFSYVGGDIFGFLNSDDILLPGALSRVARAFEDNPDVDLVMGHIHIIDEQGRKLRNSYADEFDRRAFAYGGCTICQPATFFRARAFRDVGGFNINSRVSWDTDLFLDILESSARHMLIEDFLAGFRMHDQSLTGLRNGVAHLAHFERRFERLMGRPWRRSDELIRYFYYARKYWLRPRSLWERLSRGSIFKSSFAPKY